MSIPLKLFGFKIVQKRPYYINFFIIVFLNLPFLEIRAERRQKFISVEFSFATVFAFKHPVSAAYVIVLLTIG